MTTDILNIKAYDFDLPENLIAQYPANPPDSCKLLICKLKGDKLLLKDEIFKNIINYLKGNEVLFFNNTKVIKARLLFNLIKKEDKTFFVKISDNLQEAKFEILFLNQKDENIFEALVRPGKKLKPGSILYEPNL
jgi:S-adenosylmethionine:tRNA ribosyltransferase-isomerase